MDEFNPFAAPARDAAEPPKALANENGERDDEKADSERPDARASDLAKSYAKAIKRLNKHLANPQMVERDRVAQGRRFRPSTVGFTSFAVVLGTISYIRVQMRFEGSDRIWMGIVLSSFVIGAVALMAIISDLISMPKKKKTPLEAMDQFLTALRVTRFGHAWTMLAPTARKEEVVAPSLGVLPVQKTPKVLQSPAELEQYIKTFWHSPMGNYLARWSVDLVEENGDVAIVKVEAVFRQERLWLIVVAAVVLGYFMLELGGLGALLAMYFGGKGHQIDFLKTLIRGSDGHWYMYSGNFFESINEQPRLASASN
jgi:hypothetical protein